MKPPITNSQLTPSIAEAMGYASPVLNSTTSSAVKPTMAASRCWYVRVTNCARRSLVMPITGSDREYP
jgi:hypothetical protein